MTKKDLLIQQHLEQISRKDSEIKTMKDMMNNNADTKIFADQL